MSMERQQPPRRREEDSAPPAEAALPLESPAPLKEAAPLAAAESAAPATVEPAAAPLRIRRPTDGPRVWLLPTADGRWLTAAEGASASELATALNDKKPVVMTPELTAEDKRSLNESVTAFATEKSGEQTNEALFGLLKYGLVGAGWLTLALIGSRLPGWLKALDLVLIPLGIGFLGYAVFVHGMRAVNWYQWRLIARDAILDTPPVRSKLLDRLAAALHYRANAKPEDLGQSPDAELLDANAYRKLIKEGVATAEELGTLGNALEQRLKLAETGPEERKLGEIARDAGVDKNTLIFYRDLVVAAREIRLENEFKV